MNLVQLTTDPTLGGPALATAPLGSATSAGAGTPPAGPGAPLPALAPDGVGPPSSLAGGFGGLIGGGGGMSPGQGGFFGVIGGLLNQIGGLLNQFAAEANAEGPGSQTVGDGTFSSTGDPHLTETASVLDASGNATTLNRRFDSMTGHDNLLSSQDFDGGYRVSTTVTTPDADGRTLNASATIHLNSDLDTITLNRDGTSSIQSGGSAVTLTAGQSTTLGGGETVIRNADDSLTVAQTNMFGGAIATTLRLAAGGVDVTATVHNATVGGDIAAGPPAAAPAPNLRGAT